MKYEQYNTDREIINNKETTKKCRKGFKPFEYIQYDLCAL